MSNNELEKFILQASKCELKSLLREVSAAKLYELENAICRILKLM